MVVFKKVESFEKVSKKMTVLVFAGTFIIRRWQSYLVIDLLQVIMKKSPN